MKTLLMHRERDFLAPGAELLEQTRFRQAPRPAQPAPIEALVRDLAVDTLTAAMAGEDVLVREIAHRALLEGMDNDADTILYRQAVLRDCLANPHVVQELYALTIETVEQRHKSWWGISSHFPGAVLSSAVDLMRMLRSMLRRLRGIAEASDGRFHSEGFTRLFAMLRAELDEVYMARIDEHLAALKFRKGVLESAALGPDGAGEDHVLRLGRDQGPRWLMKILGKAPQSYSFRLHERDEAGARILTDLRNRGIVPVANALAQSAGHVAGFFDTLRAELAFYVGCLGLRTVLESIGAVTAFPVPQPIGARKLRCDDLYDVSLALSMGRAIVGNTIDANGKGLVIVTGANQGGKSSFLRSVGLAQLMMQCGMFVAARSFEGELCSGAFSHYKREEDAAMRGGKLDEELARMGEVTDLLHRGCIVLFNESFASTNEREGSEIARQVVGALRERAIKVFFVTHLYDFASSMEEAAKGDVLFLRAEREPDGTRTFRLAEAPPQTTSHGKDLYGRIFADVTRVEARASRTMAAEDAITR